MTLFFFHFILALAELHSTCVQPGSDIPNPGTIFPEPGMAGYNIPQTRYGRVWIGEPGSAPSTSR